MESSFKKEKRFTVLKKNIDIFIRNILIILMLINLVILTLNYTNAVYSNGSTDNLQSVLNIVNGSIMWINSILLYIFSVLYIIVAVQSKKEMVIKIAFSLVAVLTNIMTMVFLVNGFASIFKII